MPETEDRIRRYMADVGVEGDVDERLARLDDLTERAGAHAAEDVPRLAVLGDATRYRLARALADAGEELCACELHPMVEVSESAASHALADLVEVGLAERRREGRWHHYEATPVATRLFAALDEARD